MPYLETFLSGYCLIIFPAGAEKELRIYYRDLVGEISISESQYFYSVRAKNTLTYSVLGTEKEISAALRKVYSAMEALYRPERAA
jgi:hypothetical protein